MRVTQYSRERSSMTEALGYRVARVRPGDDGWLDPRHRVPQPLQPAFHPRHPRLRRGVLLILRQAQADDVDPPAAEAARDQHDGIQRQGRAWFRRMVQMYIEVIRERQLRLLRVYRDAISRGKVAQRHLAGHREIAQQMRVG